MISAYSLIPPEVAYGTPQNACLIAGPNSVIRKILDEKPMTPLDMLSRLSSGGIPWDAADSQGKNSSIESILPVTNPAIRSGPHENRIIDKEYMIDAQILLSNDILLEAIITPIAIDGAIRSAESQ